VEDVMKDVADHLSDMSETLRRTELNSMDISNLLSDIKVLLEEIKDKL